MPPWPLFASIDEQEHEAYGYDHRHVYQLSDEEPQPSPSAVAGHAPDVVESAAHRADDAGGRPYKHQDGEHRGQGEARAAVDGGDHRLDELRRLRPEEAGQALDDQTLSGALAEDQRSESGHDDDHREPG